MALEKRPHRRADEIDRIRDARAARRAAEQLAGDRSRAGESFDFGPTDKGAPRLDRLDLTPPDDSGGYVCGDCSTPIKKGQRSCRGCGLQLNWEGVA